MHILVVEDETNLREGMGDLLRGDGHRVALCADGSAGLAQGLAEPFDLIVLDVMLPGLSGLEVCRRLREARPGLPILLLTARGGEDDKVEGLSVGADDHVTKPFATRELLARVRALGRRGTLPSLERLEVDGLTLDLPRLTALRDGRTTPLTPREAGMLRLLHRKQGEPVSRAELLEHVWGLRGDLETRAVDMAVAVLRKKVERDPAHPTLVLSVKGVGYAWGGLNA